MQAQQDSTVEAARRERLQAGYEEVVRSMASSVLLAQFEDASDKSFWERTESENLAVDVMRSEIIARMMRGEA